MTGWWLRQGVTIGVPVAVRCTPLVTAVSGMDLARPVAGGLDLLAPRFLIPGRLCVGSPGSRVALAPSRQRRRIAAPLMPVSRRRTIPGTAEGTEIPVSLCEH
jgi:hypothetical protein